MTSDRMWGALAAFFILGTLAFAWSTRSTDFMVRLQDNNGKGFVYCPSNLTMRLTLLDTAEKNTASSTGACMIGFGGGKRGRYRLEVLLTDEPSKGISADATLYDGEVKAERAFETLNIRLPNVSQKIVFEYLDKGQEIPPFVGQQVFTKPISP